MTLNIEMRDERLAQFQPFPTDDKSTASRVIRPEKLEFWPHFRAFNVLSMASARQIRGMIIAALSGHNVIITGESGVGKSSCAHALIEISGRDSFHSRIDARLLPVSDPLDALTETLSDPQASARGRYILLSHVDELDDVSGARIVRMIASGGEFIRVIATSRSPQSDLSNCLRQVFHECIEIAPLRDRYREVGALAQAMLLGFCEEMNRSPIWIDPIASKILESRSWPGNFRELANVMRAAALLEPVDHLSVETLERCFG